MRGLMERSFKNVASIALPERNKDYVMQVRGSPGKNIVFSDLSNCLDYLYHGSIFTDLSRFRQLQFEKFAEIGKNLYIDLSHHGSSLI